MADPYPTCWLNGEYLPLAEARISPLDRGFLFADGAYEVVPVHRGRPFRMRPHLERFDRSLAELRIRNPLPLEGWVEVTDTLVAAASAAELLVYLQVTRGMEYGRNHLFPPASVQPTGFAFVSPYPQPAQALLERGLAAVTLEDTRWTRCDIKSIALLANVLLRQEAQDKGGAEAILTRDGRVTEGSSSTVFIVREGRLATPPNDRSILPGTSRDAVIELAAGWLPVEIRTFGVDELRSASEVWIASAGRGVLPVTAVDGKAIGTGAPGASWLSMYARLQQHLDAIAARPALADA
ncbi:MAG: D-amino acid aminotransferase [Gammaproteobacteria bacterium]|nr:D-amino acid aminotransferase [Gammaproteobacteria bacterium]